MSSVRVKQLDGFRWVAILMIAFFHCSFLLNYHGYGEILGNYFRNPTIGVDYFFILSGYGVYIRFSEDELGNGFKFAIERVKKIYPFYVCMLIVTIPYSILMDLMDSSWTVAVLKALVKFVGCLTLLQSAFGSTYISHALVSTTWFLSTLFICYIFCPMIIKLIKRIKPKDLGKALVGVEIVTVLAGVLLLRLDQFANNHGIVYINDLYYGSVWARIWYLVIGMLIAAIYKSFPHVKLFKYTETICTLVFLVWFFARKYSPFNEEYKRIIDIMVVTFVIFSLIYGDSIWVDFFGGRVSRYTRLIMYVFLSHLPIIWYVNLAWNTLGLDTFVGNIGGLVQLIIIMVIQVAVTIISDKLVSRRLK